MIMEIVNFFKKIHLHILILIILLFFGFLNGSFSYCFQKYFYTNNSSLVCCLMLLVLDMIIFWVPTEKYIVLIIAIVGLLYDSFFIGILGIHSFLLGVLAYLLRYFRKNIPHTPLYIGLVYILSITFVESGIYFINEFIGITQISFLNYVAICLGPTIVLNVFLFIILYFP